LVQIRAAKHKGIGVPSGVVDGFVVVEVAMGIPAIQERA
jgi:hypothetical protein